MKKQALFIALGVSEKPGISGGETRFMEVAKGWEERGYKIHLLSTGGGPYLCEKFDLKAKHHVIRVKNKGRLGFVFRFFSAFLIPKSLRDFNEGIVVSTNEQLYDVLPGLIIKLRNTSNIKWGVVTHWLPPFRFWIRKQSTALNSLLFLISERISLYLGCIFADKVLAVSSSTKKQIEKDIFGRFAIKKVEAVECGVNYDDIRKVSEGVSKEYEAVFMKRIQAVKGAFDLPKIWKEVIRKLPNAKLYVIGSGIDGEKVREVVEEEDLSDSITFKGPIFDFDKKIKEVSKAKLFLLPSYEENWAIVIGEAMASGTTVVTYDLPELREVWGNNLFFVPVGDTQEFAKKILELLEDSAQRQEIRDKALEYVKKYDWKNISEKELKILLS
ncbi:glycosyltransferase family 4 protein [Patescibacteria group bacterium]